MTYVLVRNDKRRKDPRKEMGQTSLEIAGKIIPAKRCRRLAWE